MQNLQPKLENLVSKANQILDLYNSVEDNIDQDIEFFLGNSTTITVNSDDITISYTISVESLKVFVELEVPTLSIKSEINLDNIKDIISYFEKMIEEEY